MMSDIHSNEPEPKSRAIPSIEHEDFPRLYQSADLAAIKMQRYHFFLHLFYLSFLIIGSGLAAFSAMIPDTFSTKFHCAIVFILLIGFAINLGSRVFRHDEKWFACRAIAESTKNATWRFMMKAAPFDDDASVEKTFTSKIKEIRNDKQSSIDSLAPFITMDSVPISDVMSNIRGKRVEERKEYYLAYRVRDQKTWYSKKASYNSKRKGYWLATTMALQVCAVVFSIIQFSSSWSVNLVPILMTCTAASIAWSRMRRYGELAQSYTMVAFELEDLEGISSDVTQESEFCQFVNDVEYAISREHTLWCVRREVVAHQNN